MGTGIGIVSVAGEGWKIYKNEGPTRTVPKPGTSENAANVTCSRPVQSNPEHGPTTSSSKLLLCFFYVPAWPWPSTLAFPFQVVLPRAWYLALELIYEQERSL